MQDIRFKILRLKNLMNKPIIAIIVVAILIGAYFLFFTGAPSNHAQNNSPQSNSGKPLPPPITNTPSLTLLPQNTVVLNFNSVGEQLQVKGFYIKLLNITNDSANFEVSNSTTILGGGVLKLNQAFTTPAYNAILTSVSETNTTMQIQIKTP